MNPTWVYIGVGILAALALTVQFFILWRRHQKDYRGHLEPILESHGLRFVASRWPGFFRVGPFPKFEVEVGRPQSRVAGMSGEFTEYRIVTARDGEGRTYEVWAKLEFELFRLRSVQWRAADGPDLPLQAQDMLEGRS